MTQLPESFYVIVGILIVANLGVILSLLTLIFKAGQFVSSTNMGIADAKDCGIRAHKRIDDLKGEVCKM